jgi:very-short-patch-repair endonuclease
MKSKIKIQLAREFRKAPTRSEQKMWQSLRRNRIMGLHFRRQQVIDGYIVDFYCDSIKLAIEIDGSVHQKQIKEDNERQKILEAKEINFFRVSSREVEDDADLVLRKLEQFICSLSRGR